MLDKLKGCFLHQSDHWATPKHMYNFFTKTLGCFDPCPLHSAFDGLSIDWPNKVFVNPPYSNITPFINKALEVYCSKKYDDLDIYFLVPSRTDTKWFSKVFPYLYEITFIEGRLHFNDSKNGAPFPSMILHLSYRDNKFYRPYIKCNLDSFNLCNLDFINK